MFLGALNLAGGPALFTTPWRPTSLIVGARGRRLRQCPDGGRCAAGVHIEERLSRYVPIGANGHATKPQVSELTRHHLRKTMAFFLALTPDQDHVPFARAGTGTLNTLVSALLTVIAEMQPESLIFAMAEPKIAVPTGPNA